MANLEAVRLPPPILVRREGSKLVVYRVNAVKAGELRVEVRPGGRRAYFTPDGLEFGTAAAAAAHLLDTGG